MPLRRWLIILVAFVGLLGLALTVGLPLYARSRAIAVAAQYGVALKIGSVSVLPGALTLREVAASAAEVPGVNVDVTEIEVALVRFSPTAITLRGIKLQLDGDAGTLAGAVSRWRLAHAKTGSGEAKGEATTPAFIVHDGQVSWTRPAGKDSRIEANGVDGQIDLDPHAVRDTYKLAIARTLIDVGSIRLGPWGVTLDRASRFSSTVITLDPAGKKKSTVHVGSEGDDSMLDVDVSREKLTMLGIPGVAVGLGSQDPEVAAQLHVRQGPKKGAGTLSAELFGVHFGGVSAKTDVRVAGEGTATDPARGFEIQKGTFGMGPFSGSVTGTIHVDAATLVNVDLAYKSRPIACADLVAATAAQNLGGLAGQLGAFAQAAGLTRAVAGEASISGVAAYDSMNPVASKFTVLPVSNCGISLFSL